MENRLSVPRKMRREVLEKYSNAVAHYQPLMEQKISELAQKPVRIGKVSVKDMKELSRDLRKYTCEQLQGPFERILYDLSYPLILLGSVYRTREAERDFLTYWFNKGFYLSFYHGTNPLEELQDQNVIHELSHGLWIALGGEDQFNLKVLQNPRRFKRANEGFASFCEFELFKDLYPNNFPKNREVFGVDNYTPEKTTVERLVQSNGEESLLDFPKNWRKFTK